MSSYQSPEILRDFYPDEGESEESWMGRQAALGLEPIGTAPGEFWLNGRLVRRWRYRAKGSDYFRD